ncbi:hypothetical protein V496_06225 [Pseudogymnoascus sp. VKM F-4515 (FW-2607)]|nr:hypothetical protein V496_06225 [Pseudogymnoascus sp. VKM F-4515 (FW-2607)]
MSIPAAAPPPTTATPGALPTPKTHLRPASPAPPAPSPPSKNSTSKASASASSTALLPKVPTPTNTPRT